MKEKRLKEIRLNNQNLSVRSEEEESDKMLIEGYPVVFNQETYIDCGAFGWYESIDPKAFEGADISDVALKYNHNDNILILARTRNESLKLSFDEKGIFINAELIDTQTNKDVYKMVKSGLLQEGSFAFTCLEQEETKDKDGAIHRKITKIGKLFDVAICPNGAYGDLTSIYARSAELLENMKQDKAEALKRIAVLRVKNRNKIMMLRSKK